MSRTNRKLPGWASEKNYESGFMKRWTRGLVQASKADVRRDGTKLIHSEIWSQKAKKAAKKMYHRAMRRTMVVSE